jgi:hypothetical protein
VTRSSGFDVQSLAFCTSPWHILGWKENIRVNREGKKHKCRTGHWLLVQSMLLVFCVTMKESFPPWPLAVYLWQGHEPGGPKDLL